MSRGEGARIATVVLPVVCMVGCVLELDEEHAGIAPGEVVEDCVVPLPEGLASWGAPVSIEYPDRSLWIWTEVTTADGTPLRNIGAFVTDVGLACGGQLALVEDGDGAPIPLVALTAEEEAENASRTDGRNVQLSITSGFVHNGQAYAYYEKTLVGPGFFDAEALGIGLCRMETPGAPCERLEPGTHPEEPTLLWDRGERPMNRGAFVAPDGYVYLWGCMHVAAFEDPCAAARVLPSEVGDPASYRFAGWDGEWIDDGWNASALFDNAGAVTPGYDAFLGRYTTVTANIWDSTIELRTAEAPAEGYGDPVVLFDATPPDDWFIAGGVEHSALSADGGRTIAVSYFTTTSGAGNGLHLVAFRFAEGG